jgi:RNA polymerase sigma factor (sigma-70 family)
MDAPPVVAGQAAARAWGVRRLSLVGDERLARLVGGGSERAFGAIYERYHRALYGYCRSIVREDVDAQDVLQSTFASAFVALRRGRRDAPLRPWLFRIAHNEAISLIRRRRSDVELADSAERCVGSAEDRADERARLALLVEDLRELPDRQRSALVMRELSGLSHEEIAVVLETSIGAAKQAVFEARRALP